MSILIGVLIAEKCAEFADVSKILRWNMRTNQSLIGNYAHIAMVPDWTGRVVQAVLALIALIMSISDRRCPEALRLMFAWYRRATILSEPDEQAILDDRARLEYQETLKQYREHLKAHGCARSGDEIRNDTECINNYCV